MTEESRKADGWSTCRAAGTERRDGILADFWRSWSATSRCPPLLHPPIPPNHNKAKALIGINKLILLQFARTRTAPTQTCERRTRTRASLGADSHEHTRCSVTRMRTVRIAAVYKPQALGCNYCFWCMTAAIVWEVREMERARRTAYALPAFTSTCITEQKQQKLIKGWYCSHCSRNEQLT